nr:cytochrome P450 4C1-like [Leptinotarsa decemlineata]
MEETYSNYVKISPVATKRNSGIAVELLLVASSFTLLTWFAQLLWRRRKLYKSSSELPGPIAFPLIGCALSFIGSPYTIFANITKMFDSYPGLFRVWFGPRLFYAVSDPKYFEILLPTCLRKEPLYHHANVIVGHGLFTAPVDIWKKHRKLIAPTFHQKILDNFVEVFAEQGAILVDQLKKYSGKGEFDLFHVISKCTLDIICETAMGVKVNAQTTDALYTKWADRIMEIIFMRIFVIWYHFDSVFNMTSMATECGKIIRNMHQFSGKVVREKKLAFEEKLRKQKESTDTYFEAEPVKRKAFLDYLLEVTTDEQTGFTEEQLREEVDTFIVAVRSYFDNSICLIVQNFIVPFMVLSEFTLSFFW